MKISAEELVGRIAKEQAAWDLNAAERFWPLVCERAEREGYYNEVAGGIVKNYHRAATEILAEMRRAIE